MEEERSSVRLRLLRSGGRRERVFSSVFSLAAEAGPLGKIQENSGQNWILPGAGLGRSWLDGVIRGNTDTVNQFASGSVHEGCWEDEHAANIQEEAG